MAIIIIYTFSVKEKMLQSVKETSGAGSLKNGVLIESISNLETIKSLNALSLAQYKWEEATGEIADKGIKTKTLSAAIGTVSSFVTQLNTVLLIIFGAYMAETFRGAILAIERGQLEAAYAYGMSPWQVFHRVLFPQMVRHALPGFGNNWLVLLKTTALVSVIGLDDMVRKAGLAAGSTQLPFTFYMAVALIFLAFTAISTALLRWAEVRYAIKTR